MRLLQDLDSKVISANALGKRWGVHLVNTETLSKIPFTSSIEKAMPFPLLNWCRRTKPAVSSFVPFHRDLPAPFLLSGKSISTSPRQQTFCWRKCKSGTETTIVAESDGGKFYSIVQIPYGRKICPLPKALIISTFIAFPFSLTKKTKYKFLTLGFFHRHRR